MPVHFIRVTNPKTKKTATIYSTRITVIGGIKRAAKKGGLEAVVCDDALKDFDSVEDAMEVLRNLIGETGE